jgi:hypothetical protein
MRSFLLFVGAGFGSLLLGVAFNPRFRSGSAPIRTPIAQTARASSAAPMLDSRDKKLSSPQKLETLFALQAKIGKGLSADHAFYEALTALNGEDFAAAAMDFPGFLARFTAKQKPNALIIEAWIDRWLEVDRHGALTFFTKTDFLSRLDRDPFWLINGNISLGLDRSLEAAALKPLARAEPEWVMNYLLSHEPGPKRDPALYTLLDELTQRDADKAKSYLAQFATGPNRRAALHGYVNGLSIANARAGFEVAFAEPAGPFRNDLLASAMRNAATEGLGVTRALLDRIDDPRLRLSLADSALRGLVQSRSADFLPWIIEESARTTDQSDWQAKMWREDVASALQGAQVSAAADWALTCENDSKRLTLGAIADRWAASDSTTFRQWLSEHATDLNDTALENLSAALGTLARDDPSAVRAWCNSLPAGALRDYAELECALNGEGAESGAQLERAYASLTARDLEGNVAKRVASIYVANDGSAAATWALEKLTGNARDAALPTVTAQWSERDPRSAAQFIEQMPAGRDRDVAARDFAIRAAFAEPSTAAQWVEQVGDPASRAKAAETVFWIWDQENPGAARAWVRVLPGVNETWRADFLRKMR